MDCDRHNKLIVVNYYEYPHMGHLIKYSPILVSCLILSYPSLFSQLKASLAHCIKQIKNRVSLNTDFILQTLYSAEDLMTH